MGDNTQLFTCYLVVVAMAKAMAVFDLEPSTWHVLAADRAAWRGMLRVGTAPPDQPAFSSDPMHSMKKLYYSHLYSLKL